MLVDTWKTGSAYCRWAHASDTQQDYYIKVCVHIVFVLLCVLQSSSGECRNIKTFPKNRVSISLSGWLIVGTSDTAASRIRFLNSDSVCVNHTSVEQGKTALLLVSLFSSAGCLQDEAVNNKLSLGYAAHGAWSACLRVVQQQQQQK